MANKKERRESSGYIEKSLEKRVNILSNNVVKALQQLDILADRVNDLTHDVKKNSK